MSDPFVARVVLLIFALALGGLVTAFILNAEFRSDVLSSRGEAKVFGTSVKGAGILVIFAILVTSIVYILTHTPSVTRTVSMGDKSVSMRLNVHFDPNEVNPRNPEFKAEAYIKTPNGPQQVHVVPTVVEGALSVQVQVPDMDTPFFVVFRTPKGTWQTDDHSVKESPAVAYKQEHE